MIAIKNAKELKKHLDKNKDLILKDEDIRIEYQVAEGELRDVYCRDLFLMDDNQTFDFNGRDFNGGDFNGWDFNGGDFNGRDFKGWDFKGWGFNGRDFNGRDFKGKKVSYYAFFNCYGEIHCNGKPEGRREPHAEPVSLAGVYDYDYKKDEPKPAGKKVKIKVASGQILEGEIVEDN